MTHGVISHNSDLFYLFQSGAINESLADIMGEIVDHRHAGRGDSPATDWAMGEDLPIGALRDLSDPRRFGQPGPDDQQPATTRPGRAATPAACTPTAASATRPPT